MGKYIYIYNGKIYIYLYNGKIYWSIMGKYIHKIYYKNV